MSRAKDVSIELTEVRTVLSRAKSAIKRIELTREENDTGSYPWRTEPTDPDSEEMVMALKNVITELERWGKA